VPHGDAVSRCEADAFTDTDRDFGLCRGRTLDALVDSLAIGMKALGISAERSMPDDEEEMSSGAVGVTMFLALLVFIGIFIFLPSAGTKGVDALIGNVMGDGIWFHIVESIVRIAIFLAYLWLISRMPDLQRVFQYHGAEHKTISCYEAGQPLTPENAQTFSRFHPRCGTSFLLIVMIVAIFVFAPLGKLDWHWLFISRVVGIPLVAGIAFEVIKWFGRNRTKRWARVLMWPGMQLQRLTTREPDLSQLAVAIAALEAVLAVENPRQASEEDRVGMEVVA
jgi:uncharacterized protein YqhQ